MSEWTADELARIGRAEELLVASRRPDGILRGYVTIWVVHSGDGLFIRSAQGADNPWYRRAASSGVGHIRAAGIEKDVTFKKPEGATAAEIDAAYHAKYDRYGPQIVGAVTGPTAATATFQLHPNS